MILLACAAVLTGGLVVLVERDSRRMYAIWQKGQAARQEIVLRVDVESWTHTVGYELATLGHSTTLDEVRPLPPPAERADVLTLICVWLFLTGLGWGVCMLGLAGVRWLSATI